MAVVDGSVMEEEDAKLRGRIEALQSDILLVCAPFVVNDLFSSRFVWIMCRTRLYQSCTARQFMSALIRCGC